MSVVEPERRESRSASADEAEPVEVMTDLVGDVAVGDKVLVHAGVALVRLES